MNNEVNFIPHQDFTPEERSATMATLVAGNVVLREVAMKAKANFKANNPNVRYSMREFTLELFKVMGKKPKAICIHDVIINKEKAEKIMAVKAAEWRVLCGFSKMISKLSKRFYKSYLGDNLSYADFYDEAVMACIRAIYGYTGLSKKGTKVEFSTYAHSVIVRHLVSVSADNLRTMSNWTGADRELHIRFERFRIKANRHVTVDEAAAALHLTVEERKTLDKLVVGIYRESDMCRNEGEGGDSETLDTYNGVEEERSESLTDEELQALERSNLTDWEKKVIEALKVGGTGWMTKLAQTTINPTTNKPYSRMAPTFAINSIREKVRRQLAVA